MHFPLCLMDALPSGEILSIRNMDLAAKSMRCVSRPSLDRFGLQCYCFARLSCRNENRENIKDVCCTDEFQPQEEFFGGRGAKCLT